MYDVFISYAREDRPRVKKLVGQFVALRGWSVWWDNSLRTGEHFPREIQTALSNSRCVLVVWSHHSVNSDWVCAEAAEGWKRGILAPVSFDRSEPPMPFRQTEAVDLTNWSGSAKAPALPGLVEDIERIHARGASVDPIELLARQTRKLTEHRQRLTRRIGIAAGVATALLATLLTVNWYTTSQANLARSTAVAKQATELREEVVTLDAESQRLIWSAALMQDAERLDKLHLSLLLAVEAWRIAPSDTADTALREALVLLPWSDWHQEINSDSHFGELVFSHDGTLLAAGGGKGDSLVWDYQNNHMTHIDHGGNGNTDVWVDSANHRYYAGREGGIDFSPVDHRLATAGPDNSARIWETLTGTERLRFSHKSTVTKVRFTPDGQWLATAGFDGTVKLWDTASGALRSSMRHDAEITFLAFSSSGRLLASVSRDGTTRIWNVPGGEPLGNIAIDTKPDGLQFSPDDSMLATFGSDQPTRLWSLSSLAVVWEMDLDSSASDGPIFLRDGSGFVLGTYSQLGWWNLKSRRQQFSVMADGPVIRTHADRTASRLVTVSNQTARVWSMTDGHELKRMPYAGRLTAALSPDGNLLATVGWAEWGTGAIEVTRVWPQNPVSAACDYLPRNLTRNEWRQYFPETPYRPTCPELAVDRATSTSTSTSTTTGNYGKRLVTTLP